jgi:hypothetical protein
MRIEHENHHRSSFASLDHSPRSLHAESSACTEETALNRYMRLIDAQEVAGRSPESLSRASERERVATEA